MKVDAITLRSGHVIEHNGKLYQIMKSEIYNPGKGASVVQVDMRDVRTGLKASERFRTQEAVERARLDQYDCTYLFGDADSYTFMNKENYEQITIPAAILGDKAAFLQDGMEVEVEMFETEALNVTLPDTVILEVVEADPVVKGQTASSSYKPALLSNGVKIQVPPHIEAGMKVVVKTETGTYSERAK